MNERLFDSICNVYVPVKDLDEGIDWYCNKLGFQLLFKETSGRFAAMKVDPAPSSPGFLIVKTDDDTTASFTRNGQSHQVVCFNVNDIERTHQCLVEQGIEAEAIVSEHGGTLKYFVFKDLYGNRLEALRYIG
ncbi:VOC family protein [Paenibacillus kobensis]|uniref:VOC family protein n=1 Tax=Paenibacillus kobensis TaxID=59841 RepID=UPI0013E3875E|nr:VOC family protein [Paenibacillus kobensis]